MTLALSQNLVKADLVLWKAHKRNDNVCSAVDLIQCLYNTEVTSMEILAALAEQLMDAQPASDLLLSAVVGLPAQDRDSMLVYCRYEVHRKEKQLTRTNICILKRIQEPGPNNAVQGCARFCSIEAHIGYLKVN